MPLYIVNMPLLRSRDNIGLVYVKINRSLPISNEALKLGFHTDKSISSNQIKICLNIYFYQIPYMLH